MTIYVVVAQRIKGRIGYTTRWDLNNQIYSEWVKLQFIWSLDSTNGKDYKCISVFSSGDDLLSNETLGEMASNWDTPQTWSDPSGSRDTDWPIGTIGIFLGHYYISQLI